MKSDVKKRYTLIVNGEFIVPNGKTKIVPGEFYGIKSMISVRIPDSMISIGKKAFCNCESLTSVHIPDGVIYIGYEAFYAFGSKVKQAVQNLNFKLCEERGMEQMNDYTLFSKKEAHI